MKADIRNTTLGRLIASVRYRPLALRLGGILGFVGLLALGAHARVYIPGNPVPVTFQTFFVLLAGAVLGPWDALASVALYMTLGAAGVPLFAGATQATGLAYFAGPTGGYLAGFVAAVLTVGLVTRRTDSRPMLALTFLLGAFIILAFGSAYLWLGPLGRGPLEALMLGFVPYVIGDIIKALLALFVYSGIKGVRGGF